MNKRKLQKNEDEDLDGDRNEPYEPSDSDDDYDDNEKLLLERARKGKPLDDSDEDDDDDITDDEEEVLGVYSSEEEEKEDKVDDSDIEGMEDGDKLPDEKAWGKRKKDYYYTDYVDQDFGGFAREEEEEAAVMEEKEARNLQNRLASQLDDVDLSLGLITEKEKKDDEDAEKAEVDIVKTDLSKLTKREKLVLFEKESPEFFGHVKDYKDRMTFAKDKLLPIMRLIRSGLIPSHLPCSKFIELKTHLTLNYSTNLAFYLLLKVKKITVNNHPVTGRLLHYRKLLQQLDAMQTKEYLKQTDDIIREFKNDQASNACLDSDNTKQKQNGKKKKLNLLMAKLSSKVTSALDNNVIKEGSKGDLKDSSEVHSNDSESDNYEEEPPNKKTKSLKEVNKYKFNVQEVGEGEKRAITYEMAKNKGLTPYRTKEQRNPRVKHRNKYRKAMIRRKGQVREVRKEISKYGGEISGIKASVIKSRKLK